MLYVTVFLIICAAPFTGLLLPLGDNTSSDNNQAEAPTLIEKDSINIDYLSQSGSYFETHFAFRTQLIDAHAHIQGGFLKTSPTEQVIIGKDGWLFYGGTLDDYLGRMPLTQRAVDNIAHNLALMQGYGKSKGAKVLFVVAPNKNSLYPEQMPYYYRKGENNNVSKLFAAFDQADVAYVDLFKFFESQEEVLYFTKDSHWNYEGAILATNAVLKSYDKSTIKQREVVSDIEFIGDIEKMLYPITAQPESVNGVAEGNWAYVGEESSVEAAMLETTGEGEGSLLMFRDSFANNMIPLLAPEFENSYFSKMVPYDLTQINHINPDCIIIERAERHIDYWAKNAPLMPAPLVEVEVSECLESDTSLTWYEDGDFAIIEGWVDEEYIESEDSILIQLENSYGENQVFVPFYISGARKSLNDEDNVGILSKVESDYGFSMTLPKSYFNQAQYTASVLVVKKESGKVRSLGSATLF